MGLAALSLNKSNKGLAHTKLNATMLEFSDQVVPRMVDGLMFHKVSVKLCIDQLFDTGNCMEDNLKESEN